jgi:GNAT superfamily N-acetyltransferase
MAMRTGRLIEEVAPNPAAFWTDELTVPGAPGVLRDGSRVRIRQIRPSDEDLLVSGFERLSPESRYRRFLSPLPELTRRMVRYLADVDHHDHEAMVALDEQCKNGVGLARYVRNAGRPDTAEVAVTVIDEWQGRGLGTLLLDVISARARAEGIAIFTAVMLAENEEMLDLLKGLGPLRITDRSGGTMTVEVGVAIPPSGIPAGLRKLLRTTARREVVVPPVRAQGIKRPERHRDDDEHGGPEENRSPT